VTILPDALTGWGPLLALFDSTIVTALAPMLDRLSRAIGPMRADDAEPSGDPAGYEGVAARGSYERLLPSEWLLADELPDEFLRRAVAREHLFYAVARERPRGRRAVTILVDVGPELFGTPRVAALAALLVLAHRARSARASFGWKLAQGQTDCVGDVGALEIRALLGARAAFICDEESLRTSVEAARQCGEAWVVAGLQGSRAAERLGASVVTVEDVIDANARELAVSVRVPGQPQRATRLPLPDERACLRVLRDPFPRLAPPTVRAKARGALVVARPLISPVTPNVFARLADGGVLVLPLPRSKRQDLGNGRALHLDAGCGEIVAAGHVGGKAAVIAQRDYDLTLAHWRGKRSVTRRIGRSHEALRPLPLDGRLFPLVSLREEVVFVGRGGRLLEFRPGNRARVLTSDCCALTAFAAGKITFAVSGDSRTDLRTMRNVSELAPPWAGVQAESVLLSSTSLGGVAVAFESDKGSWTAAAIEPYAVGGSAASDKPSPILHPDKPVAGVRFARFEVPQGSEVVAVLDQLGTTLEGKSPTGHVVSSPALLFLENDGRQLRFTAAAAGPEFSIALPGRAVHVVVDAATRVAVCITDTAELLLVALAWRSIFARFTGQGRVA
jgi:hypothetical protein